MLRRSRRHRRLPDERPDPGSGPECIFLRSSGQLRCRLLLRKRRSLRGVGRGTGDQALALNINLLPSGVQQQQGCATIVPFCTSILHQPVPGQCRVRKRRASRCAAAISSADISRASSLRRLAAVQYPRANATLNTYELRQGLPALIDLTHTSSQARRRPHPLLARPSPMRRGRWLPSQF
jgi:hypothetical protein